MSACVSVGFCKLSPCPSSPLVTPRLFQKPTALSIFFRSFINIYELKNKSRVALISSCFKELYISYLCCLHVNTLISFSFIYVGMIRVYWYLILILILGGLSTVVYEIREPRKVISIPLEWCIQWIFWSCFSVGVPGVVPPVAGFAQIFSATTQKYKGEKEKKIK